VELSRWTADELVDYAARALSLGRIVAVDGAPIRPAPGVEPAADAAAAPSVAEVPEDLFDPRWSAPRVAVGDEVLAIVSYAHIKAPKRATIVVSEVDDGGVREEIARVPTTVPVGSGDHRVRWRRAPEDARRDLEADAAAGDRRPLEYRFRVACDDPSCSGESGPLWLTNTVTVNVVKERDRAPLARARTVVLRDAVGQEQRARTSDASVTFERVLVGPIQVRLAAPRFDELAWAAPRVGVGEAVDAVFRYADAAKGMLAHVVVYETNHDGAAEQIAVIDVELGGVEGEARASFTRSEEQAQHDVDADAAEGDTGPTEYRFRVVADGEESELSDALWLTHAVTIRIGDKALALPEGMRLVLIAADGTVHEGALSGGAASFEQVVCGPMIVRLAGAAGPA
ncbi:MAG TPA: hypothetical protein VHB21_01440, partial [Minicystis sp.]|nr:hypothetical protein [Minicystis sp.]